jgi:hypothetical protein
MPSDLNPHHTCVHRVSPRRVCQRTDKLQKEHFEPWIDTEALRVGDNWDQIIRDQLEETNYVIILYIPALSRKTDGYVNKEIALARDRALSVRGTFMIPLRTIDFANEDRIAELSKYNDMLLREANFDNDLSDVISIMRREYQRRRRD